MPVLNFMIILYYYFICFFFQTTLIFGLFSDQMVTGNSISKENIRDLVIVVVVIKLPEKWFQY